MTAKRRPAVVAAIVVIALLSGPAYPAELERITIATNPSGTLFYVLAGGFARLFQEQLGVRSSPRPYGASPAYLPLLARGEVTLGLNTGPDLARAYQGIEPFTQPIRNVRLISKISRIYYAYFARADSDLYSINDLKGQRVVFQMRTSVSLSRLNETVLATADLSEDDIKPVAAGHVVQSINLLIEGRTDAAITGLGIADMRRAHASIPGGVRVLELGPKASNTFLNATAPGTEIFVTHPSPGNVGVAETMEVAGFDSFLAANAQLDDEAAYELTRTLHTNWGQLQRDYPALRALPAETLAPANNPAPYHPGALRYWREIGLLSSDDPQR